MPRYYSRKSRRSSALVLTLMAVVLVTLAVLLFLSSVTSKTQIENSRVHEVQAELLVRTAGDYVKSLFLQEIITPTYSTVYTSGANSLYVPIANTNAVPLRLITPALNTDANFFNLIRQSIASADPNTSADNTSSASSDGRTVGPDRWNASLLVSGAGFTSSSQLPNWIYVDRLLGATSSEATPANLIGRFAYNVYDIGGLLNANVAGYPGLVAADPSLVAQFKNSVAGADLTCLSPAVTQSIVDRFLLFRNPTSSTDTNKYYHMVQSASVAGFLNPVVAVTNSVTSVDYYTNNLFNNRQDLLRYARTQNLPMTNAAPYLTTFSRSLGAPSWSPQLDLGLTNQNENVTTVVENYNYKSNANASTAINPLVANVRFASAGTVTHYNDDGASQTFSVQAGDPLMQHRFSLAKLAWLTHTGPATGISAAAIRACFGLAWSSSGTWVYAGPSGGVTLSSIETLQQVVAETTKREPNFFEVLQAGILHGSLGASGADNPIVGYPDANRGMSYRGIDMDSWNRYYQVLRIGANLIDQARGDNYPTSIQFSGTEITEANGYQTTTLKVWGIKDLPYINKIVPLIYWPNQTLSPMPTGNMNGPVYNYYAFELWNPHRQSSVVSNGPTKFRLTVLADPAGDTSAGTYKIKYHTTSGDIAPSFDTTGSSSTRLSIFTDAPSHTINFTADGTSATPQQSYREPNLIRTGTTEKCAAPIDPTLDVFDFGVSHSSPDPSSVIYNNVSFQLWATVFVLEYLDTDGATWRPYTTFLGRPDQAVTGFGGNTGDSVGHQTTSGSAAFLVQAFPKADPRSMRFDSPWGMYNGYQWRSGAVYNSASDAAVPNYTHFHAVQFGYLPSNNPLVPVANEFYTDPDGVERCGDCYVQDQNPFAVGNTASRPVILGRPFQSVAEMGYAFRDVPFKSLDFFTSSSGDSALLDLFSVRDEALIQAGKVNLNSMQPLVQQSLLSGTTNLPSGVTPTTVATDYQGYSFNSGTATSAIPRDLSQLANFISSGTSSSLGATYNKVDREAAVRLLAGSTQTRTWNLLIDVVAQTGRFTKTSGTVAASDFLVEGEKHCWLSVAIDRYTGKIIDQKIEYINE